MQVRISNSYGTIEVGGTTKEVAAVLTIYSSKILQQSITEAEMDALLTGGQELRPKKK